MRHQISHNESQLDERVHTPIKRKATEYQKYMSSEQEYIQPKELTQNLIINKWMDISGTITKSDITIFKYFLNLAAKYKYSEYQCISIISFYMYVKSNKTLFNSELLMRSQHKLELFVICVIQSQNIISQTFNCKSLKHFIEQYELIDEDVTTLLKRFKNLYKIFAAHELNYGFNIYQVMKVKINKKREQNKIQNIRGWERVILKCVCISVLTEEEIKKFIHKIQAIVLIAFCRIFNQDFKLYIGDLSKDQQQKFKQVLKKIIKASYKLKQKYF